MRVQATLDPRDAADPLQLEERLRAGLGAYVHRVRRAGVHVWSSDAERTVAVTLRLAIVQGPPIMLRVEGRELDDTLAFAVARARAAVARRTAGRGPSR
ncbi:MAG: hypothetical protein KF729_16345 [Sandaracinaceae bacterium]|nr:hypothetical protein [Sandaracinaceae bacterium]